jgi:voltage-gated potassium channel
MPRDDEQPVSRAGKGNTPRLAVLFFALLLFSLSYPLFGDSKVATVSLDLFFSATLIASAYAVSQQRKTLAIAIVLALPSIGFWWALRSTEAVPVVFTGLALSVVFFLFISATLLRNVLSRHEVTADIIFGAMCVYLLVGVSWGFVYALVELANPGSFDFGPLANYAAGSTQHGGLGLFGYYSLVTLSTLGYGDITPVAPLARSLSSLEAIIGQLYIAVLIARLVGIHIAQKHGS